MSVSREKVRTIERRGIVGRLYMRGLSIKAIQAEVRKVPGFGNTNHNTVWRDIEEIKDCMVKDQLDSVIRARATSVAKLRQLQKEAWDAIDPPGNNGKKVLGLAPKDKARYLELIASVEEKIIKLEGTFAPERKEHEVTGEVFFRIGKGYAESKSSV